MCIPLNVTRLVGFCDALGKAYAPVVYLQIEDEGAAKVSFLNQSDTSFRDDYCKARVAVSIVAS